MIHGTTTFSTADLNPPESHLFGKYKNRKIVYDVELLEENESTGMTHCRIRGVNGESDSYDDIKTSKLYDLEHSGNLLW